MGYQSFCNKYGPWPLCLSYGLAFALAPVAPEAACTGLGGISFTLLAEGALQKMLMLRGVGITRGSKYLRRFQVSCVAGGFIVGGMLYAGSTLKSVPVAPPTKDDQIRLQLGKTYKEQAKAMLRRIVVQNPSEPKHLPMPAQKGQRPRP